VVLADGLGGAASEALIGLAEGPIRPRAGLRARCQALRPLSGVEIHLGRGAELYLTPLPNGEINMAALFDSPPPDCRGAGQILAAVRRLYPAAAEYLGPLSTPPALRNLAARPPRSFAQNGAFVAGDAAGGVDPVLGCGVTIALVSGLSAARSALAVVAGGDPRRAANQHQRLVADQVRVRRRLAAGLNWLSRHPRLLLATARFLRAMPLLTRSALRLVVRGSGSPTAPSSRPGTRNVPAPLSATGGA
jgi:2-polyprenyl-6-methoxyphenol hydroxylase-like FAD-dependent oxidoreductase